MQSTSGSRQVSDASARQTAIVSGLLIAGLSVFTGMAFHLGPVPVPSQPELPTTVWQLDHILVDGMMQRPPDLFAFYKPMVQFVSQTEVVGFDGCNYFRGTYDSSAYDGTLTISAASQTLVACEFIVLTEDGPSQYTQLHPDLLEVLFSVNRYELKDNRGELRLHYPEDDSRILVLRPSTESLSYSSLPPTP